MGRSGGGGSSGGGMSHSSHSSSHSHSSHSGGSSFRSSSPSRSSSSRVSGSSFSSPGGPRPGGGGFRPAGGYRPAPPPPPRPPRYRRSYGYSRTVYVGGRGSNVVGTVIALFIIFVAVMMIIGSFSSSFRVAEVPVSTINREPLKGGSFTKNCVVDDIGWVRGDGSTEAKVGGNLEYFWKKTGIQPYVVLLEESSAYSSSDARWDKAEELFQDVAGGREDAIMLVYFDAEPDGEWEMVKGKLTLGVMDDEACEMLWGYCDRYWYDVDHYSVPQAIESTFKSAADSIMVTGTTGADVANKVVLVIAVILVVVGILIIMKTRRKHEAERAQETEAILQAGQNQANLGTSGRDDLSDLTSRYD